MMNAPDPRTTEDRTRSASLRRGATLAFAAILALECGVNDAENEEVMTESAFSVSSCASVAADHTFFRAINPPFVTPRSYNTCYKSYVVEVSDLSSQYVGTGNVANAHFGVDWADTPLTTQASCEGSEVAAIFYRSITNGGSGGDGGGLSHWIPLSDVLQMGTWQPGFGGQCTFDVALDLVRTSGSGGGSGAGGAPGVGDTFRIAVTGRSTTGATRRVSIGNYRATTVH